MSSVSENEIFESFSREDTYNFAKALGEKAEPGQVFCLSGDLGVGKTVFAQGFGAGVGVTGRGNNRTYVQSYIYHTSGVY